PCDVQSEVEMFNLLVLPICFVPRGTQGLSLLLLPQRVISPQPNLPIFNLSIWQTLLIQSDLQ
ncbi:hypothetical protein, partial [Nocardioides malaquae]|uniref:hypothetical protein n=1 Tax=Nocardioides malaquae TaxID=2773426 RepID=UPI001D0D626A